MRNLKRALSLALAAIMLIGMMAIGTSAASVSDFTDADKITNLEAASVTTAIGIFDGYSDGSFGGEDYVTRAQMATIVCKILSGANVNADIYKGSGKFQDLAGNEWAEGYINMCASLGIITGTSATTFEPGRPVKTWEAALMLQRALGWWAGGEAIDELAVTAKSSALRMYGDLVLNIEDYLTRNDVAELVFNTITKSVPVEYNESFALYRNAGSSSIFSGVVYSYTDTLAYNTFGLAYKSTVDVFGRAATSWGYGVGTWTDSTQTFTLTPNRPYTELVVVPDEAVLSYTNTVRGSAIYSALGLKSTTTFDLYVDGLHSTVSIARNGGNLADSGRGVQTLVYENPVGATNPYTIVVINTYIMGVDSVTDAKGNTPASVRVGKLNYNVNANYPYLAANFDATYETDVFERDDVVLITVALDDSTQPASASNQYKIQSMQLADAVSGTLNSYSRTNGTATVDTTVYNFGKMTNQLAYDYIYSGGALKDEVLVYLDNYGNAMDIQEISQETSTDYALVLAVDTDTSSVFDTNNAWVKMLLMDGSIVTGKFTWVSKDTDSADNLATGKPGSNTLGYKDLGEDQLVANGGTAVQNKTKLSLYTNVQTLVTYSVDSNGVYTLHPQTNVALDGLKTENNESAVKDGDNTPIGNLNAASVLIVRVDPSKDDYRIYTGVREIPTINVSDDSTPDGKYVANTTVTKIVDVIYTEVTVTAASKDLIYIVEEGAWTNDRVKGPYVTFTAIVNGEVTEIDLQGKLNGDKTVSVSDALQTLLDNGSVFTSMTTNNNGVVTNLTAATSPADYRTGIGFIRANRDVVGVGDAANTAEYFTWSDDVKVVFVDLDLNVDTPRITNLQTDPLAKVIYNVADDNAGEIVWIYVIEQPEPPTRQTHKVDLNNMDEGDKFAIEGVWFEYDETIVRTVITENAGTEQDPHIIATGQTAADVATAVAEILKAVTEIDDAYYVVAENGVVKFVERTAGEGAPTVAGDATVASADSTSTEEDAEEANPPASDSEEEAGTTIALTVDVTDLVVNDTLPTTVTVVDGDGQAIDGVSASIAWVNSSNVTKTTADAAGEYTGTITVTGADSLENVTYTVNGANAAANALTVTVKAYVEISTVNVTVTGDTTITLSNQTTAALPTVAPDSGNATTGVTAVSISWKVTPTGGNESDVTDGANLVAGTYTGTITATADADKYYKLASSVTYTDSANIANNGVITVTVS